MSPWERREAVSKWHRGGPLGTQENCLAPESWSSGQDLLWGSCLTQASHPPIHPPTHPTTHPTTHQHTHPLTYPPINPNTHPPTYPPINPPIHSSIHPRTHPCHCPPTGRFVHSSHTSSGASCSPRPDVQLCLPVCTEGLSPIPSLTTAWLRHPRARSTPTLLSHHWPL